MKGNTGKLAETEWNFGPLIHKEPTSEQRSELLAAIIYEYARESDSIRKLAAEYVTLPEAVRRDAEEGACLFAHSATFYGPVSPELARMGLVAFKNCILWPKYFPETPWLDIPAGERIQRVQKYREFESKGNLLTINECDESYRDRLPMNDARFFSGGAELLVVCVNWAAGNNSDIVAAFTDWVGKSRPGEIPEPRGDASRANVDAAYLTRLAVMRLRHSYQHSDAWILAKDHGLRMPSQQSNALKMRHKVKVDQRRLFQSEGFPGYLGGPLIAAGEVPRSWSTARARRR